MEEDIFYGIKHSDPFATTVLFHELGHFYHNHLENGIADMDIYDAQHLQDMCQGKVSQQELEANHFAASYLGTNVVIDSFKSLTEKIVQRYKGSPDEWAEAKLAIAELNMRIEVLHKKYEVSLLA
jgi:Zn-dependent peptidase ImmA (M78 family)